MGKHLTDYQLGKIKGLYQSGKSVRDIGNDPEINRSPSTISMAIKRLKKTKNKIVDVKEMRGRKRRTTPRSDRFIVRQAVTDPFISSKEIRRLSNI